MLLFSIVQAKTINVWDVHLSSTLSEIDPDTA